MKSRPYWHRADGCGGSGTVAGDDTATPATADAHASDASAVRTDPQGGPARTFRSHLYPASFRDRVPKTVRTPRPVRSDFSAFFPEDNALHTEAEGIYQAWTNSHGAVAAVLSGGRKLGLKPGEFEVVEWYGLDGEAVPAEAPAPKTPDCLSVIVYPTGPYSLHLSLSVRGALAAGAREWRRLAKASKKDDGTRPTWQEIRDWLLDELVAGHELARVGNCDNFDPTLGCLGHPDPDLIARADGQASSLADER